MYKNVVGAVYSKIKQFLFNKIFPVRGKALESCAILARTYYMYWVAIVSIALSCAIF